MTKFEIKLKKRVELGAKWLTKNDGDWVKNTDLVRLDMANAYSCMLGQAFTNFWEKVHDSFSEQRGLSSAKSEGKISEKEARALGFMVTPSEENRNAYDILAKLWTKKIQRMRKARAAAKKKRV